jgi:hypothetical protein
MKRLLAFLAPLPPDTAHLKATATASIYSIVFLFQVFMTLALTNGATNFFIAKTDKVQTHKTLEWGVFIVFILTVVKFAHSIGVYLMKQYPEQPKAGGYRSRSRIRPFVDFFLPFVQALVLYVVSSTIAATATTSISLDYFKFTALFLAIDIVWCVVIGWLTYGEALGPPYFLGRFAGLNVCTLVLAYIARLLDPPVAAPNPHQTPDTLPYVLIALLLSRAAVDFRWSYNTLYPWVAAARA